MVSAQLLKSDVMTALANANRCMFWEAELYINGKEWGRAQGVNKSFKSYSAPPV